MVTKEAVVRRVGTRMKKGMVAHPRVLIQRTPVLRSDKKTISSLRLSS